MRKSKKLIAIMLVSSLTLSQNAMAFNATDGVAELTGVVDETKKFSKTGSYLIGSAAGLFGTVMTVAKQSIPLFLTTAVITIGAFKYPGIVARGATLDTVDLKKPGKRKLTDAEKRQIQFELLRDAEKLHRMLEADPELKAVFKSLSGDPTLDTSGTTPIDGGHDESA